MSYSCLRNLFCSEQLVLIENVPAHCRGIGLEWPLKVPSNPLNHHSMMILATLVKSFFSSCTSVLVSLEFISISGSPAVDVYFCASHLTLLHLHQLC